ncbi:MAG TPA: transposase [Solirubrobacteraceae bacterium]|nr:transposase [Solirubrobacteraceae bacterium]
MLDAETGELQFFTLGGDVVQAAGLCAGLPRPVRAAYEAGPTGYGLARELAGREVQCVVAAPSKIPRASGDRVKTDRRDAEHLVRLLLAGKLRPVRVPGPQEEALRDLVRAREAVRVDLMRSRHRLSKIAATSSSARSPRCCRRRRGRPRPAGCAACAASTR